MSSSYPEGNVSESVNETRELPLSKGTLDGLNFPGGSARLRRRILEGIRAS